MFTYCKYWFTTSFLRKRMLESKAWSTVVASSYTIQCNFIVSLCREICLPGSNSWLVCLAAEQSCTSAVAFRTLSMTLLRAAVETAISEVHKLLRTGGVPISITLLFWRWLTVSLRVGALGWAIHLYPPTPPPPFPSQISLTVSVDHERRRKRGKALGWCSECHLTCVSPRGGNAFSGLSDGEDVC